MDQIPKSTLNVSSAGARQQGDLPEPCCRLRVCGQRQQSPQPSERGDHAHQTRKGVVGYARRLLPGPLWTLTSPAARRHRAAHSPAVDATKVFDLVGRGGRRSARVDRGARRRPGSVAHGPDRVPHRLDDQELHGGVDPHPPRSRSAAPRRSCRRHRARVRTGHPADSRFATNHGPPPAVDGRWNGDRRGNDRADIATTSRSSSPRSDVWAPQTNGEYPNIGFATPGRIIKHASGTRAQDFITDNLPQPRNGQPRGPTVTTTGGRTTWWTQRVRTGATGDGAIADGWTVVVRCGFAGWRGLPGAPRDHPTTAVVPLTS